MKLRLHCISEPELKALVAERQQLFDSTAQLRANACKDVNDLMPEAELCAIEARLKRIDQIDQIIGKHVAASVLNGGIEQPSTQPAALNRQKLRDYLSGRDVAFQERIDELNAYDSSPDLERAKNAVEHLRTFTSELMHEISAGTFNHQ